MIVYKFNVINGGIYYIKINNNELHIFRQKKSYMLLNNTEYELIGYGEIKKQINGWYCPLRDNHTGKSLYIRTDGSVEFLHHGSGIPITKREHGQLTRNNDTFINDSIIRAK